MARRATSFGPKPSLCFFFVLFCFCFVFCFGGFKGQVRWPKGPPHLALNPPNCFIFCFVWFVFVPFLSLFCNTKNLVFPLEKGHFCLFLSVSLCSSLAFFGLPIFSVFLSLSLSCSCPFFLPSCLSFLLSFASLFLSLSFLFFLLCFCFMTRTTSEYSITKLFFINIFSFLVSCLLLSLKSLFLIFVFFADLKLCFCSTSLFLVSNKPSWKTPLFGQKGGCNKTFFFMNLCFAKCEKLSFFWGHFFGKFWLMFKKHYKIGISAL